ncbi:MAG: lysyl-tRNA synthetase, class, partial [Clostridia bacterium]|nr:lysyl-tRNA synthetase, class [Clostridia bacterium]
MEVENDLMAVRLEKMTQIREAGIEPYGCRFECSHTTTVIHQHFAEMEGREVTLAGRLRAIRGHGKASFADLQDQEGHIQLYIRIDNVGPETYELFRKLDIGDIIGVKGKVFRTHRGEISVEVHQLTLLCKSLRPLPEKWHGLKDIDLRYRQRYLDLIVNPEVRQVFITRARILRAIRSFL